MNSSLLYLEFEDLDDYMASIEKCSAALQYYCSQLSSDVNEAFILLSGWEKQLVQPQSFASMNSLSQTSLTASHIESLAQTFTILYNACATGFEKNTAWKTRSVCHSYPDFTILPISPNRSGAENLLKSLHTLPYPSYSPFAADGTSLVLPEKLVVNNDNICEYPSFLFAPLTFSSYHILDQSPKDSIVTNPFVFNVVSKDVFFMKYQAQVFDTSLHHIQTYRHSVIGGTFDHLHEGHKVLLTACSLVTRESLTIGLSSGVLLEKKQFKEFIQPFTVRKVRLEYYLNLWNAVMRVDIVPLFDPIGPSGDRPYLDVLFVSEETRAGGTMVNAKRRENGLEILDVIVVPLSSSQSLDNSSVVKLSSTQLREREWKKAQRQILENSKEE